MSISSPVTRFLTVSLLSAVCMFTPALTPLCQQAKAALNGYAAQDKKPLTNADITRMVKSGFAESVIINAIQSNETQFDVSLDALFKLKEAGLSQKIIEAMQTASARHQTTPAATTQRPPTSESSLLSTTSGTEQTTQPYVLFIDKSKTAVAAAFPTVIQTKAKGDNIPTILADATVQNVASDVIIKAASGAILSSAGMAAIPIVGMAGMAIMSLPKVFGRDPSYTFIYALDGNRSPNIISTTTPKFEVAFGDVTGANPDEFDPVLVKVNPTKNNWRLVSAQKTKLKNFQSDARTELNFIEEIVPIRTNKLGRGRIEVEPQQPLPLGEYGLVLRPTSKIQKVSLKDMTSRQGEGVLLSPVWDFSITAPAHTESQTPVPEVSKAPASASEHAPAAATARDRQEREVEQSKVQDSSGSVIIKINQPPDQMYERVLTFLKRRGLMIESASKETGQILTGMTITGGYRQTGTRIQIALIKDGPNTTSIRVSVTEQKRYKALKTEPWGDPKINPQMSGKLADELMAALATA
ncbi:MAG: hypothetical protein WCD76_15840 [Pyrinomonadaceae bacterium]